MRTRKRAARLERMNQLIKMKATGSPGSLADRLHVSEATVYRDIQWFRSLGMPIKYCKVRQSYYYEPWIFRRQEVFISKSVKIQAMKTAGLTEVLVLGPMG
ncbi:MAG: HTH domain-containing protein [Bacteroidetes bacterium]|nr:HTH domain-containing protein [Bacteroidota bacterium]